MLGSSIGERFGFTSFGESHGRCVGAVVDGCPAGLELEEKDKQNEKIVEEIRKFVNDLDSQDEPRSPQWYEHEIRDKLQSILGEEI